MQHLGAVFRIAHLRALAVGGPLAAFRLEPVLLVHRRQRDPSLRLPLRLGDLKPGHDLETAPSARLRRERALRRGKLRQGGGECKGCACLQEIASVEVHYDPPRCMGFPTFQVLLDPPASTASMSVTLLRSM